MPESLPLGRYLTSDYASFCEGDTGIHNLGSGVGNEVDSHLKIFPVLSFISCQEI